MKSHVVLLADLKGTKNLLERRLEDGDLAIETIISSFRSCFSRTTQAYFQRSRSFTAYVFSDSLLAEWDDPIEGRRVAPRFAKDLLFETTKCNLPVRIFIEEGALVESPDDLGKAMAITSGRYYQLMPVSVAVMSVFLAEANHFPNGLFFGVTFSKNIGSEFVLHDNVLSAGPFNFSQLKD
jgi:hypothetical protein